MVKLKEFILTNPLLYEMLKELFKKKKKIKTMNTKVEKNSQLSTTEPKKKKKNKLSKQPEQEQNHRYGNLLEGYQLGGGRGRMGEKMQGLRSINW